jgi:hypothetical protein
VERSRTAKSKTQARAANVMHGIRVAAEMARPAKHEAGVDWLMRARHHVDMKCIPLKSLQHNPRSLSVCLLWSREDNSLVLGQRTRENHHQDAHREAERHEADAAHRRVRSACKQRVRV